MTAEVISLPLPTTLLWAYLAKQAAHLGCRGIARKAVREVQRALTSLSTEAQLWEQSPSQRSRLDQQRNAYSATTELRAACHALLLAPILRKAELYDKMHAVGGTGVAPPRATATSLAPPGDAALDHLMDTRQLVMALQLALTIDDAPLASSAVQAVYTAITPLLQPTRRSLFVLEPLCACLAAPQLLTPARLLTIRRASRLLACVGFELVSLAHEWGLDKLGEHAAASMSSPSPQRSMPRPPPSPSPPLPVSALPSDAAADALAGSLYAEYAHRSRGSHPSHRRLVRRPRVPPLA